LIPFKEIKNTSFQKWMACWSQA